MALPTRFSIMMVSDFFYPNCGACLEAAWSVPKRTRPRERVHAGVHAHGSLLTCAACLHACMRVCMRN
eukprot:356910-Chlamydomonas_euryale.AAC.2